MAMYTWGRWSKWIAECRADENHVVVIRPKDYREATEDLNIASFRAVASKWGTSVGGRAHVNGDVGRKEGIVYLQFCWDDTPHQGIHSDAW